MTTSVVRRGSTVDRSIRIGVTLVQDTWATLGVPELPGVAVPLGVAEPPGLADPDGLAVRSGLAVLDPPGEG